MNGTFMGEGFALAQPVPLPPDAVHRGSPPHR
jgi:hypothetical protein